MTHYITLYHPWKACAYSARTTDLVSTDEVVMGDIHHFVQTGFFMETQPRFQILEELICIALNVCADVRDPG